MTATIVDVGEATFERDVLERSYEVPVVVDFWADWCAPCRALGPVLERLAVEGDGRWVLARVDVDANQRLALEYGVQGIPAVRAFKDGRQAAEFVGALPEPQVRQWLAQLGPSEADEAYDEGLRSEEEGDLERAAEQYRRALSLDPGHVGASTALAQADLALRTKDLDVDELRRRIAVDPADIDAALGLADIEIASDDYEAGFNRLIETIRSTQGEDRERARLRLLSLLKTLPPDDQRAVAARRALSMALF